MKHFSEQAWADLARGTGNPESAENIGAHLRAGCSECKTALAFWGRIRTIATDESTYTPPENLVRCVKLEFAVQHERQKHEYQPRKWTLANLLFDSLTQPLPAGVRSAAANARQVVYEAEGLTVDLRFDRPPQSNKVCVVGQMLDRLVPRTSLHGASIVLWTEEGRLVATAEANEFGEFQLEFEPQNDLRLSARAGHRLVQIPLTNLK